MATLPIRVIDGDRFDDYQGFTIEFAERVGGYPGMNLDAFNDILRGGYGTPDGGFILHWLNSERSRSMLGYEETARRLEDNLKRCHPSNIRQIQSELNALRKHRGSTLFDIIVEIIRIHGEDGAESMDSIELHLL